MSEEQACKAVCAAEEEHGHREAYLVWTHQADGFCYFRCTICGWIKPDTAGPTPPDIMERVKGGCEGCAYARQGKPVEGFDECVDCDRMPRDDNYIRAALSDSAGKGCEHREHTLCDDGDWRYLCALSDSTGEETETCVCGATHPISEWEASCAANASDAEKKRLVQLTALREKYKSEPSLQNALTLVGHTLNDDQAALSAYTVIRTALSPPPDIMERVKAECEKHTNCGECPLVGIMCHSLHDVFSPERWPIPAIKAALSDSPQEG